MNLLEALLLGFIQGVTEWLPISSSGHLAAAQILLGLEDPLIFDVVLHVATLVVVFIYFRRDLAGIASATMRLKFRSNQVKILPLILIGTIPVGIVGLISYDYYGNLFDLKILGFCFTISGIIVAASKIKKEGDGVVSVKTALIIGLAQALALAPGFSRSGLTIGVALLAGVKREEAFRFSFLLSIPAVLGALLLTLIKGNADGALIQPLLLCGAVAVLVGYLSLSILHRLLMRGFFHMFGFYAVVVGLLLLFI